MNLNIAVLCGYYDNGLCRASGDACTTNENGCIEEIRKELKLFLEQ